MTSVGAKADHCSVPYVAVRRSRGETDTEGEELGHSRMERYNSQDYPSHPVDGEQHSGPDALVAGRLGTLRGSVHS